MPVIVPCPSCQAQYRLDPAKLKTGRGRLRCAKCGTVFPVAAPQVEAPPPPPPAAPSAGSARRAAANGGPRLDVAIVAGEPGDSRRRLVSILARCRVRTVTVDDGTACVEAAVRSRPKLVVLHAWLRGLLGLEVVRDIRADPLLAHAAIVLVGGVGPTGRHRASPARIHGADAWVPDDAAPEELDGLFRSLLGLPGGRAEEPAEADVSAWAQHVVAELFFYHADAIDAGLRLRQPAAGIRRSLEDARLACLDRFPVPAAGRTRLLALLDGEVERALARRGHELGLP